MKDPIVILGPGRCGSTLLQRILNTSSEITIWGEHSGFLAKLSESYYILTKDKGIQQNLYSRSRPLDPSIVTGQLSNYSIDISWINPFDCEIAKEVYINLIVQLFARKINPEQVAWGFKEIRYTQEDPALKMILELFPETRIVFSIRNPFDVIKSMILAWVPPTRLEKKFQKSESQVALKTVLHYAKRWNDVASSFQYWIAQHPNWNYHIDRYEHLVQAPESVIKELFEFLNVPMPDTALKPMSAKAGKSPKRTTSYEPKVRHAIYSARHQIWDLLEKPAEYFNYELDSVNSFNA